eukprot:TRINITY_DN3819_c0_g1_i1.p1 TRINITY_DN3819_c0_g1~~TRINITY_DN3819_c0_g1_i1.p1  ORF type:complete len:399 (+),score=107.91 TRINITY_DN3819_c0_g1_i1:51-1199(+)
MSLLEPEEKRSEVIIEEISELTQQQLHAIRDNSNHYDVLGLPVDATEDEIQSTYKKRAIRLHPDKHTTSTFRQAYQEAFERLNLAKVTLLDPTRRRAYDIKTGVAKVGRFSFEALKENRKTNHEDYRRIEYEIYKQSQLETAGLYQEKHESEQLMAFDYIVSESRAHILEKMRNNNWTAQETAVFATEYIGKQVEASEIPEWIEEEESGRTTMQIISRTDAEKNCKFIDDKGKLKGFSSFGDFTDVFTGGGQFEGDKDIPANVSDALRKSILETRAKKRMEAEEKLLAVAALAKAEEASRKRARDDAEAALQNKIRNKTTPKIETDGFVTVTSSPVKRKRTEIEAAHGVASLLKSLTPEPKQEEEEEEEQYDGLGLGGYGSD